MQQSRTSTAPTAIGPAITPPKDGATAAGTSLLRALFAATAAALAGCGGGLDEPVAAVPSVHGPHSAGSLPAEPTTATTPARSAVVTASLATAAPTSVGATLPAWRLIVHPADARVAPGEAASFHVRAEGGTNAFEYQWLRDGEPIPGATTSQYSFLTTLDDGGSTFSVRVRPRGAGQVFERESAPATLSWRGSAG